MSERQIRRARVRRLGRPSKAVVAGGAALGASAFAAPVVEAATFTVTNLNDAGEGSLRQAVIDANDAGGLDTVVFQSGLSGTITLTSGDINIFEGVDIQGPGADVIAVSGNDDSRIFDSYGFGTFGEAVSISGLTLRDGAATVGGGGGKGGAVFSNAGPLTLADVVISGSYALEDGGAVYQYGYALSITDSTISGNAAGDWGGGVYVINTAGEAETEITIANTTLADNTAGSSSALLYGGGGAAYITSADSSAVVRNSTVLNNASDTDAGGISFRGTYGEDAGLTVEGTTIAGNTADDDGGGVSLVGPSGPSVLTNSTISGNSAATGGGVNAYPFGDEPITITNSTVVDNEASGTAGPSGGGIYLYGRDNDNNGETDTVGLSSTIVANNSSASGGDDIDGAGFEPGSFAAGFSLIEDPTVTGDVTLIEDPAGSNILGVDPALGPLQANGGPTQTHAPAQTSPAVDKGIANALATDQRGLARTGDVSAIANAPGGDGTDIGSVEIQAADCQGVVVFTITGTPGNDALAGDAGPNAIFGGAGDDSLSGVEGDDCLFGEDGADAADGGSGNDLVDGGAGRDNLRGGPGRDRVRGAGGRDKVKGNGGRDNLKGGPGKDNVKGSGGKDKLRGQGGKDKLNGGGGKDNVKGGAGKDKLRGGPAKDKLKGQGGKDKINAVDGKRDKVNCGGGNDRATVDPEDKVSQNCEKVIVKG